MRILWGLAHAGVAFLLFMAAVAMINRVSGQEIHHHPGASAAVDEYYSKWMIPPERFSSCCNRIDCAAAEVKIDGGHYFFKRAYDLNWIEVPRRKIENFQADARESPDGMNHLCVTAGGVPLCAVLGAGL